MRTSKTAAELRPSRGCELKQWCAALHAVLWPPALSAAAQSSAVRTALLASVLALTACDSRGPVRAHAGNAEPPKPASVSRSETPELNSTTTTIASAEIVASPKPLPARAPHTARPIVPPQSEALSALIAKTAGRSALARLRRHLLGERLYCDFVAVHNPDTVWSLDQITNALPSLTTLPDLATRAEKLLTQAGQLAQREQDPAVFGQAAQRLLTQIAESLLLLEQALTPGLDALRGPILRRIDAKILTARKVEEPSFTPITRELLILRDRIQRMGDLLDSQRSFLQIRRATLTRLLSTPTLLHPDTLSEATTLTRSIIAQLHKTLSAR
jgi:hypothetical protein